MLTSSFDRNGDVESLAALWAVRTAEGPLTDRQQGELDDWLDDDPKHLGAFVRAQAAWIDIDRVAALHRGARDETVSAEPPRRYWLPLGIAASLVVTAIPGAISYQHLAGRISTSQSEIRRITLDDGSIVVLDGNSAVQVRYDEHERHIILRRGDASFKVAHNRARPFIVTAGDVSVTAVGTAFAVGRDNGNVAVTVEQGVVKVVDWQSGTAKRQYLKRNEQLVAADTGPRRAVLAPAEVSRSLSWREGLLVFDGQLLGSAASEVNRYAKVPVMIDDPTLARAEFVGVFHVGNSRAFADAAAHAFNGEVIEHDGALHIVRQQNSPSH